MNRWGCALSIALVITACSDSADTPQAADLADVAASDGGSAEEQARLVTELLMEDGLAPADADCIADGLLESFSETELRGLMVGDPVENVEPRVGAVLDLCDI